MATYDRTFLLIWNPKKWPPLEDLEQFEQAWDEMAAGIDSEVWTTSWSFGTATENSDVQIGDRIFFLRVGDHAPRGILASGHITSDLYFDRTWESERSAKQVPYVDIEWDRVEPLDAELPVEVLKDRTGWHWWIMKSGTRVPEDVAATVEQLWAAHSRLGISDALPLDQASAADQADVQGLRVPPSALPLPRLGKRVTVKRIVDKPGVSMFSRAMNLEEELVQRYIKHLWSKTSVGRTYYQRKAGGRPYISDVYDIDGEVLIEAKNRSTTGAVRGAVGQLFDYARFHDTRPTLRLLLPRKPSDDNLDFLRAVDVEVAYVSGKAKKTFTHCTP
ncbi:MAG: hypothetical protein RIE08_08970 [Acidimicrobiales bacterium]